MKTLILLNADQRTDESRYRLFHDLCARQNDLQLWYYRADQDLSEFHANLPAGEIGQAQLWMHTSAFGDDESLSRWVADIDASWLAETQVVFYSGGGLEDWDAGEILANLNARGVSASVYLPALPAGQNHPGWGALKQRIDALAMGIDLASRAQLSLDLIEALLTEPEAYASLTARFGLLCEMFSSDQQGRLQSCWRNYSLQPDGGNLMALRDALLVP